MQEQCASEPPRRAHLEMAELSVRGCEANPTGFCLSAERDGLLMLPFARLSCDRIDRRSRDRSMIRSPLGTRGSALTRFRSPFESGVRSQTVRRVSSVSRGAGQAGRRVCACRRSDGIRKSKRLYVKITKPYDKKMILRSPRCGGPRFSRPPPPADAREPPATAAFTVLSPLRHSYVAGMVAGKSVCWFLAPHDRIMEDSSAPVIRGLGGISSRRHHRL